MFNQDRTELRQQYFDVWQKLSTQQTLNPFEKELAAVIVEHKEYHGLLNDPDNYLDKDYLPEFGQVNPFLHMSLHLTLREQVSLNRPKGIRTLYEKALAWSGDLKEAEHFMMDVLVEMLWQSQKQQRPVSDSVYIKAIKKHLKKAGV
ncbi:DUF1841 family protein [Pleionea sp. CnH1-48]|uniref:DUF1841 family protein n=1 Tax=Pleionea sp. CnH1-48 TaxID=2954494 RepID=UPI002097BF66|nr:DUF1841 family protein [Pleionea sp. CnH1-48]MCO7227201.1 DUF1841 family protein [Pleionea sp. CnH1-48]